MTDSTRNTGGNAAGDQNGDGTTIDEALGAAKGFVAQAGETISDAVATVVDKVKENPKAAAAIAAGAAATVAGAAYGVTKLREGEAGKSGGTVKSADNKKK